MLNSCTDKDATLSDKLAQFSVGTQTNTVEANRCSCKRSTCTSIFESNIHTIHSTIQTRMSLLPPERYTVQRRPVIQPVSPLAKMRESLFIEHMAGYAVSVTEPERTTSRWCCSPLPGGQIQWRCPAGGINQTATKAMSTGLTALLVMVVVGRDV